MPGFCKILCTYLMDRPRDIKYFHKLRKKNMFNINNKVLKKCLIENCLMLKIISNHWQRCSSVFIIDFIVDILLCCVSGSNTGFEFGWRYKCIRSLEHHKCQKYCRQIGLLCSVLCLFLTNVLYFKRRALFLGTSFFWVKTFE